MIRRLVLFLLAACLALPGGDVDARRIVTGLRTSLVTDFALNRTTCNSPCYVFADALDATNGTSSTLTTIPFHEIDFKWDWGDPGSGTWSTGAQAGVASKNTSYGAFAGHVYECTSGSTCTYTVGLSTTDGSASGSKTRTVTVTDADAATEWATTKTVCVNNTGDADFTGCPAGATQNTTNSLSTAFGYLTGSVKRLLFKRAGTWNATTFVSKNLQGPGLIGAYGSGAKPTWTLDAAYSTSDTYLIRFASSVVNGMNDWRIMDIHVDGSLPSYPRRQAAFEALGQFDQFTFLRISYTHMNLGVEFSQDLLAINERTQPGQHLWDQLAIVDCDIRVPANSSNTHDFFSGERYFYAGNNVDVAGVPGDTKSHDVRIQHTYKGIVAHNSLANPGGTAGRHMLKAHSMTWLESSLGADDWAVAMLEDAAHANALVHPNNAHSGAVNYPYHAGTAGKSKYLIVSDNKTTQSATNTAGWHLTVGPQDGNGNPAFNTNYGRFEDVIIERNWCVANTNYQACIEYTGERMQARNNIADATLGLRQTFIMVWRRDTRVPMIDGWVYNNTMWHTHANSADPFISIAENTAGAVVNTIARNNLVYGPSDATGTVISNGSNATGSVYDHNTGNVAGYQTDPLFTGAIGAYTGWGIQAGSPYKSTGTSVKVWRDWSGTLRSRSSPSIGAAE